MHASSPPRQEHAWHRQSSSAASPHAPPLSKEQGRHSASAGGEDGGHPSREPPVGHAGPPRSSTRRGARGHPAVTPPGVPTGAREGMSPQPPPRSAGCVWGCGCPVLRRGGGSPAQKGASFPQGHRLAAPSALEGSEPRATCVAGQGPGCALGTPGGPPAACPWPLPRLSHSRWHRHRTVLGSTCPALAGSEGRAPWPQVPLLPLQSP